MGSFFTEQHNGAELVSPVSLSLGRNSRLTSVVDVCLFLHFQTVEYRAFRWYGAELWAGTGKDSCLAKEIQLAWPVCS